METIILFANEYGAWNWFYGSVVALCLVLLAWKILSKPIKPGIQGTQWNRERGMR